MIILLRMYWSFSFLGVDFGVFSSNSKGISFLTFTGISLLSSMVAPLGLFCIDVDEILALAGAFAVVLGAVAGRGLVSFFGAVAATVLEAVEVGLDVCP